LPRTESRHDLARAIGIALLLLSGCAAPQRPVAVMVGVVPMRIVPPRGWEHVDNGGRHEFRKGDLRMVLSDDGICAPETLAVTILAARTSLMREPIRDDLTGLGWRNDPVLAARGEDERRGFWRYWNDVTYDPTRAWTIQRNWAFDSLVARAQGLAPLDAQQLARWAVAQRTDTTRSQIERVVPAGSWWVADTWSRVSHLDPRRWACGVVDGHLLVLESGPLLEPAAGKSFDALLRSIAPPEQD